MTDHGAKTGSDTEAHSGCHSRLGDEVERMEDDLYCPKLCQTTTTLATTAITTEASPPSSGMKLDGVVVLLNSVVQHRIGRDEARTKCCTAIAERCWCCLLSTDVLPFEMLP